MKKIAVIVLAVVMTMAFAFAMAGCGNDETSTDETVTEATEATEAAAEATDDAAALAGEYQDTVSQRATMTIENDVEDNELEIKVIWSDSADKTTEWDMDATLQDGKLVYIECEKEVKTYDANGAETSEQETEQGSGYFEIDDQGKLLWTGAADSDCQGCAFEKITQ